MNYTLFYFLLSHFLYLLICYFLFATLFRCVYAQASTNLPPITTHNIVGDATDPVMSAIRRCQLFNNRYDRVKVTHYKYRYDIDIT